MNEQTKAVIFKELKQIGITLLELAGQALVRTAQDLKTSKEPSITNVQKMELTK